MWYVEPTETNSFGYDLGGAILTLRKTHTCWMAIIVKGDWDSSTRTEFDYDLTISQAKGKALVWVSEQGYG